MSEENTQTATAEANAGATPPAEATGAPAKASDDLDALLEQYRKETGSTEQTQTTQPASAPAADVVPRSEFEALKAQVSQRQMAEELDQLAKGVRAAGDIDPNVLSDDEIIGILDRRATTDPALRKAWVDSAGNPKARAKLIQKMGEDLGKRFAKRGVDENATADREAVAASVRGTSTKAPEGKAPDYGKMTDSEFRKEADKYGITF